MGRILKPMVRGGGWYPSKKWIPLVRNGGYTTQNGGEEESLPEEYTEYDLVSGTFSEPASGTPTVVS